MAFVRPTVAELIERVQEDFLSRLGLVAPVLRRSMVYVLARVIAGAAHMLHGHLEFLSRQIFPDQAEAEYLERWGALFGLTLNAAAYATGDVVFTGTNTSIIPAGTIVRREDGTEYSVDAEHEIGESVSGEATCAVTAEVAGADGNCDAATEVSLESPLTGVDSTATVDTGGLSGGADEETTDEFRIRVLERMRNPPHGGNSADYVAWAKEISGVTRAWCYPLEGGPGTVTVRFVRDDDVGSIIPSAGEVTTVQTYIDGVAPVTADVTVAAPTAVDLDFTIEITPDNSTTRAAVEAELEDLLVRIATPGGVIPLSQILVAVGTASGVTDFTVTVPAADVTHATGELATMGTVTWT